MESSFAPFVRRRRIGAPSIRPCPTRRSRLQLVFGFRPSYAVRIDGLALVPVIVRDLRSCNPEQSWPHAYRSDKGVTSRAFARSYADPIATDPGYRSGAARS